MRLAPEIPTNIAYSTRSCQVRTISYQSYCRAGGFDVLPPSETRVLQFGVRVLVRVGVDVREPVVRWVPKDERADEDTDPDAQPDVP